MVEKPLITITYLVKGPGNRPKRLVEITAPAGRHLETLKGAEPGAVIVTDEEPS